MNRFEAEQRFAQRMKDNYGFLTIRLDDTTILDFMKYAVRYFISTQQYFEWR